MNGPCECAARLDELAAANTRLEAKLARAEASLTRQARDQAKQQGELTASLATQIRGLRDLLSRNGITGTTNLAAQVAALTQTVTGLAAARPPGRGPVMPLWDRMSPAERRRALRELHEWVTGTLGPQYGPPSGLREAGLRDCWPAHPPAVWCLSALRTEWLRVTSGSRPDIEGMLGWLHKWWPATQTAVTAELKNCGSDCRAARAAG